VENVLVHVLGVPVKAEKWSARGRFLHILLLINGLFSYSTLAQPSPVILFRLFLKLLSGKSNLF
jgi:hypothetical protein